MNATNFLTSSGSDATISNSEIVPSEKILAIDTYWQSLDFKFNLSPSPVSNSTLPAQLSTTSRIFLHY